MTKPIDDGGVEDGALVLVEGVTGVFGREAPSEDIRLVLREVDVALGRGDQECGGAARLFAPQHHLGSWT